MAELLQKSLVITMSEMLQENRIGNIYSVYVHTIRGSDTIVPAIANTWMYIQMI